MKNWKQFTFESAPLEIIDGDRGVNYPKQADFMPLGHCLFLNAGNVTQDGFDFSNCSFITEEKDSILRKGKLSKQDIVLTTRGTVGNLAFYNEKVPYEHIRINSGMVIFRVDQDEIFPRYFYFLLKSNLFDDQVKAYATGSAQPQLPIRDIKRLEFLLPSIHEQRAIAGILGALDDKIELNRRMNRTLESMARAVFRQWFVESENDWEEKSLDEIADFLNGLALQKFPASEGEEYLPVIKIAQLRTNNTESADRASTDIPSQYVVEDGDILFSWSGSLTVVVWCGGKGALNQHLFKVTSEKYPKWFYYYWTKHHLADFQAIAAGKATTMGHIQRHHLRDAKVLVPDDKELQGMDKVMSPILDKIIVNEKESRTLASLRDSLLPKLMRGEVRVRGA